jgi:hypothetical protein
MSENDKTQTAPLATASVIKLTPEDWIEEEKRLFKIVANESVAKPEFYLCDPYLQTPHGQTLLVKAFEILHSGKSTYVEPNERCEVFDEKTQKTIIIKFNRNNNTPREPVRIPPSNPIFVDETAGLYD